MASINQSISMNIGKPVIDRLVMLACLLVIALALGGILGNLPTMMLAEGFWGARLQYLDFPSAISLFILAISLQLRVFLENYHIRPPMLMGGVLAFVPAIIALFVIGNELAWAEFNLHRILIATEPENQMSFLTAIAVLLSSGCLVLFCRFQNREAAMFFGVGGLSLLVLNTGLYNLLAHFERGPVLYNTGMSVPVSISFILLALAFLLATLPYQGLLMPLFSPTIKSRMLALAGISVGFAVMAKGFNDIHMLNTAAIIYRTDRLNLSFLLSASLSMVLAPLVKVISLRAVQFYNRSMEYAEQQSRLRQALEYQSDLLFTITVNARSGLIMLDSHNRCTFMNPAAEKMFGATCDELKDRDMHDAIHYERADGSPFPQQECTLSQSVMSGKPLVDHHDIFIRKNGEHFPVICSTRPIFAEGNLKGMVMEVQDVTRQKQVEERALHYMQRLEQSNRDLEQFAYVASHDLKSPLRKIVTFSSILLEGMPAEMNDEQRDLLLRIHSSSLRMQMLVQDLLMLARITKTPRRAEHTHMGDVVDDVLADLDFEIEQAGAQVQVRGMMELKADRVQMYQMLKNLVENALKYRRDNVTPMVDIGMEPLSPDFCQLVVKDNGIGFDPEKSEKVFELFSRLHGKSRYEGTGIGLAICKRIVERHGGRIRVRSSPGEGTAFFVILPLDSGHATGIPPVSGQNRMGAGKTEA